MNWENNGRMTNWMGQRYDVTWPTPRTSCEPGTQIDQHLGVILPARLIRSHQHQVRLGSSHCCRERMLVGFTTKTSTNDWNPSYRWDHTGCNINTELHPIVQKSTSWESAGWWDSSRASQRLLDLLGDLWASGDFALLRSWFGSSEKWMFTRFCFARGHRSPKKLRFWPGLMRCLHIWFEMDLAAAAAHYWNKIRVFNQNSLMTLIPLGIPNGGLARKNKYVDLTGSPPRPRTNELLYCCPVHPTPAQPLRQVRSQLRRWLRGRTRQRISGNARKELIAITGQLNKPILRRGATRCHQKLVRGLY